MIDIDQHQNKPVIGRECEQHFIRQIRRHEVIFNRFLPAGGQAGQGVIQPLALLRRQISKSRFRAAFVMANQIDTGRRRNPSQPALEGPASLVIPEPRVDF